MQSNTHSRWSFLRALKRAIINDSEIPLKPDEAFVAAVLQKSKMKCRRRLHRAKKRRAQSR